MPEPESKSVDLEAEITASDLAANFLLYLAKVGETDPDLFNRSLPVGEFLEWLVNNVGAQAKQLRLAKGADVASANALTLGDDGNYFDITGTTPITSIGTKGVGTVVRLHFDGALTLTHHATDLVLPGGANITTAAGDEATFVEYATEDWRCVSYQRASGAALAIPGSLLADGSVAGTAMQELLGLNLTDPTELTISTGAVTATQSLHSIDTEGDAASDDLDTITAAKGVGDVLIVSPAHTDRTVVLKHGTGNIRTASGSDITLDSTDKGAILLRWGTNWLAWSNSGSGGLLADGSVAGTAMQELLGLNLTDPTELTISTGAVTATQSLHSIDTEGDAASDDLDTITAAKGVGDVLIVSPAHTDRTVVLKHGTGNIRTASGSDITLDSTDKGAILLRWGTNWLAWSNSEGAASGATVPSSTATISNSTSEILYQGDSGSLIELSASSSAVLLTLGSQANSVIAGETWQMGAHVWLRGSSWAGGSITIVPDSGVTLRRPDGSTGTLTIATDDYSVYFLARLASDSWIVLSSTHLWRAVASSGEMTTGTETNPRQMTPAGIKSAIRALMVQTTLQTYSSGVQDLTTTYSDVAGSSISYTPKFSSSTIKYSFNFMFGSVDSDPIAHVRAYVAGVEQSAFACTLQGSNNDGGRVTVEFTYSNASTAAKTFKLQARDYSATYDAKLHETKFMDGAASNTSSAAVITITEVPT